MKTDNELAELSENFADLQPETFTDKIADREGSGMGTGVAGRVKGVPYDRAPLSWICDKLQWVKENSPYILEGVVEVKAEGWYIGCQIKDAETGQVIPGAGVDPVPWTGGVEDMSNIAKQVYVMASRATDNTIRYMIAKGLTNDGDKA